MPTPARVVLVTIPKAGTYLFSEAVRRLGFEQTHLHLAPDRVVAYDPARLDEGRAHPERFQVDCRIEQSTRLVRHGQFAASHLPCNERTIAALDGCRVVFAVRELRSALASRARFDTETGRVEPRGSLTDHLAHHAPAQLDAMRAQLEWLARPGVLTVRFEDLLARNPTVIGAMRAHLAPGPRPADPDADVIAGSLGAETLTRSTGTTDLGALWSDDAESIFQRLAGPELNERFGYPEPAVRQTA